MEFGAYPIGRRFATLPRDLRLTHADCDPSDPNNGDGSCLYRGADGVTYYILDRSLIVNKRIDVADTQADRLSYGLTGRETPQQAVAHMQRRSSLPFKIADGPDPHVQLVTADGLFEGEGGMQFLIYLIFSANGRLEQIKLEGPPTI